MDDKFVAAGFSLRRNATFSLRYCSRDLKVAATFEEPINDAGQNHARQ